MRLKGKHHEILKKNCMSIHGSIDYRLYCRIKRQRTADSTKRETRRLAAVFSHVSQMHEAHHAASSIGFGSLGMFSLWLDKALLII